MAHAKAYSTGIVLQELQVLKVMREAGFHWHRSGPAPFGALKASLSLPQPKACRHGRSGERACENQPVPHGGVVMGSCTHAWVGASYTALSCTSTFCTCPLSPSLCSSLLIPSPHDLTMQDFALHFHQMQDAAPQQVSPLGVIWIFEAVAKMAVLLQCLLEPKLEAVHANLCAFTAS